MFPMQMFPGSTPQSVRRLRSAAPKMHPVGEECESVVQYPSTPSLSLSPALVTSVSRGSSSGPLVLVPSMSGPGVGGGPHRKVRPTRVDFAAELSHRGGGRAPESRVGTYRPGVLSGSSLQQPRLSLLGKPINYKARHRDHRYRRAQAALHNLLERPRGWKALSYHLSL